MSKPHPDWAIAHRKPGTELRKINGHYYLYKVSSKWDKVTKRTKKITERILGKITPDGEFIPSKNRKQKNKSKKKLLIEIDPTISVKEYGMYFFMTHYMKDITNQLKKHFPESWKYILSIAYCRLVKQLPINRMPLHFQYSYFSEEFSDINFTEKKISLVLQNIGRNRGKVVSFLNYKVPRGEHVLVDMTGISSRSKNKAFSRKGYNNKSNYKGQINLMYIFGNQSLRPIFYRLLPGNIRELKAFILTLKESKVKNCILIIDKGFYSKKNIEFLEKNNLRYLCPLKRNSTIIHEEYITQLLEKEKAEYFMYENKVIWYIKKRLSGRNLYIFLNEEMKLHEEKDYLIRVANKPESYSVEKYHKKRKQFGTLSLLTKISRKSGEQIYKIYKSRNQIEVMFDGLKNVLGADRTYMQNEETLQGWMFANHIALLVHHRLYRLLLDGEKLKKHSVKALIERLSLIRKAKIGSQWADTEVVKSSTVLLKDIGIPIT